MPLVSKELELILEIQTDAFWEDVTPEMLKNVRRRRRHLAELIKLTERKIVITDFGDDIGEGNAMPREAGGGHTGLLQGLPPVTA
ncbi:hypothetical protein [Leisingera methylohalidivorans]|uniref:Uncharacterized protein n=1 Tax=Leisingera methylohalidivorans DSM 14336 TaxID=999552 RepID=V9VX31_9RHOB|nr:hypothetical protein [Leisingera methylohalidivorans]AHD03301.1 hypothetical protein METH_19715 [Leisingera methylohalidivorans DSM 14336]